MEKKQLSLSLLSLSLFNFQRILHKGEKKHLTKSIAVEITLLPPRRIYHPVQQRPDFPPASPNPSFCSRAAEKRKAFLRIVLKHLPKSTSEPAKRLARERREETEKFNFLSTWSPRFSEGGGAKKEIGYHGIKWRERRPYLEEQRKGFDPSPTQAEISSAATECEKRGRRIINQQNYPCMLRNSRGFLLPEVDQTPGWNSWPGHSGEETRTILPAG